MAFLHFVEGGQIFYVDYFGLDTNPILHKIFQLMFNYGAQKRMLDPYKDWTFDQKITRGEEMIRNEIRMLTKMVVPKKALFIAIDGSAPTAKQEQQRQRRFISALHRDLTAMFDSNSITPGTPLMLELTKYFNTMIRMEINNLSSNWNSIKVIFSSGTVPGEGEHKVIEWFRTLDKNGTFCMYGPDADLIMLELGVHLPNITLLREDQYEVGSYDYVDMGLIRKQLAAPMGQVVGVRERLRSLDDVSNDFILLGFFVGNDFTPKIRMFLFLEDGLELMLATYSKISQNGLLNHLTNGTKINHEAFTKFVSALAKYERKYILDQLYAPLTDARFKNETLLRHVVQRVSGERTEYLWSDYDGYRKEYYLKAHVHVEKDEEVKKMCIAYLRDFAWIYLYYVQGLPAWNSYYPYHYAPLMEDLERVMKTIYSSDYTSFTKGNPSIPFVQLLSVLPPKSADLLPKPFAKLMTSASSPLVKAGYYPDSFKIDYEGVTREHMAVVLLPFIDVEEVKKAYEPVASTLKNQYVRNELSTAQVFYYDPSFNARYESEHGNIDNLHVRKVPY